MQQFHFNKLWQKSLDTLGVFASVDAVTPKACQDSPLTSHSTEIHLLQLRQSRNHMIPKHTPTNTKLTLKPRRQFVRFCQDSCITLLDSKAWFNTPKNVFRLLQNHALHHPSQPLALDTETHFMKIPTQSFQLVWDAKFVCWGSLELCGEWRNRW